MVQEGFQKAKELVEVVVEEWQQQPTRERKVYKRGIAGKPMLAIAAVVKEKCAVWQCVGQSNKSVLQKDRMANMQASKGLRRKAGVLVECALDRLETRLDTVLSASRQTALNLSPLVANLGVEAEEDVIFLLSPRSTVDGGVEVQVPTFSALFCSAARDVFCNLGPRLLLALRLEEHKQLVVFLLRPHTLDETGLEHLLPPLEALHMVASFNALCDGLPVRALVLVYSLAELLVLLGSPSLACNFGATGTQSSERVAEGAWGRSVGQTRAKSSSGGCHCRGCLDKARRQG